MQQIQSKLQAVGRALHRPGGPGGEKVGTIILPVLLTGPVDDADPLAAVDARGLDVVAGVMSAMRAHDASLGRRLDHSRRQVGRAAAWPEGLARARGMAALAFFKSRLHMQVPGGATGQLAGALALQMVRDTTAAWDEALGRLRAWVEDHGDAAVAQGTKVAAPDLAAGTFALGAWCTVQRTLHRRGLLAAERAAELDALPGWSWEPRDERWWTSFDALADYVEHHGAYPAQKPEMLWRGVRVGQFVNTSRLGYGVDGWLRAYPDRVAALESLPGWVWNERHAAWEDHYVLLADFAARHGHASPGIHDVVDGFNLGRWVQKERAAIREGRRSVERAARLRALPGWVDHTRDAAWEHGYAHLAAWAAANGEIPPQTWVCEDGFTLGGWVCTQRERRRRGRLDASRAARLETIPRWAWDPIGDTWAAGLEALRRYSNREGTAEVPGGWVDASGFPLGSWCGTQRSAGTGCRPSGPPPSRRYPAGPGRSPPPVSPKSWPPWPTTPPAAPAATPPRGRSTTASTWAPLWPGSANSTAPAASATNRWRPWRPSPAGLGARPRRPRTCGSGRGTRRTPNSRGGPRPTATPVLPAISSSTAAGSAPGWSNNDPSGPPCPPIGPGASRRSPAGNGPRQGDGVRGPGQRRA
jgi:hypothetical protein